MDFIFSDWKMRPPDHPGQVSNPLFAETQAETVPSVGEGPRLKPDEYEN